MEPTVIHADSREALKSLADCSIDSCVTDPPYALVSIVKRFGAEGAAPVNNAGTKSGRGGDPYARAAAGFMGQKWDTGDTAFDQAFWAEVMRVLKPGGHLVAFSGTRTYHRMAVAIEDAGFEIRDQIGWAYGSGFPKSHDVSKGIEAKARTGGSGPKNMRKLDMGKDYQPHELAGSANYGDGRMSRGADTDRDYKSAPPVTDPDAIKWQGWGTALKPAWEPICLARKPLSEGTVAANVLRWGTGALNIDGCRVETGDNLNGGAYSEDRKPSDSDWVKHGGTIHSFTGKDFEQPKGRWPANIVHDGSDEVVALFPDSDGQAGDVRGTEASHTGDGNTVAYGEFGRVPFAKRNDTGSAARFFYTAKADKDDRLGSGHPTVKPVDLMQWLVRLVTPSGGRVIDPFAGTGSTGEAAYREGRECILIEREQSYVADIQRRMVLMKAGPDERGRASIKAKIDSGRLKDDPGPLFDGLD